MKRFFIGLLMAVSASSAGWAAAKEDAQEAPITEASLLKGADDAVSQGDVLGAVQLFQSAIIYAPTDPVPYQRLAQFYAKQGETESALLYFNIALDVSPAYAPALEGLALLDLASGDRAGALVQHNILVNSCGAGCPETAQVEKALNGVAN